MKKYFQIFKFLNFAIAALLFAPIALLAQVDRTKAPKPGPAPILKIGKPASFVLPNGLKVYVVQNSKLPRVSASLTLDIDPIVEGDKAGYTNLAGELMKEGTTTKPKDDLDEEVDFLGADLNASATSVSVNSLTNNFPKAFALMADVVLHPAFPADELEKNKKRTISGLQTQKDNANSIIKNVEDKLMYGANHPYGEFETEATVAKVTLDDIKGYYNTYWKPNVAYLVFVGDITVAKAQQLTNQYFGTWKKGVVPTHTYATPTPPAKTIVAIVDRPSSVQSVINIVAPIQLKPGSSDAIATSVMNNILGESATARLFMNLREKHGFTYGAYSRASSDKYIGSFNANASVRNEKTDSAIMELMNELKRIRTEPVSSEELTTVKNLLNGSFARSLESPNTIARFALNTARYNLPADYYQKYLSNLAAVNAGNVQQVANKYVLPNNSYIVIVGNAKEIAKGLEKYGEVKYYDFNGNETKPATTKAVDPSITAESIVNNYIKAIGGTSAIASIKDVEMNGEVEVPGAPFKPAISRKTIVPTAYMDVVSAMNGAMVLAKKLSVNDTYSESGQGGASKPMDDEDKEELDEEKVIINELYYLDKKYTMTVEGIEAVDGKDAYVVKLQSAKGRKFTNYYDVATGLKLKTTTTAQTPAGKEMVVTVSFDDYKPFGGVQMPTKVIINQGIKMTATYSDIKVNSGLKVEDFK